MIKSSIEKLAEDIGYDIGISDDETQSKLLNGFCKALHNSMDKHTRETQICYIVDKLSNTSMDIVEAMAEFIVLRKDGDK